MPELPEVETARLAVNRALPKGAFRRIGRPFEVTVEGPRYFAGRLKGLRLLPLERKGKYLRLPFRNGGTMQDFLLHLGMTGSLQVLGKRGDPPRYARLTLHFEDGRRLVLRDPRRFAVLVTGKKEKALRLSRLGPDAMEIETKEFTEGLSRRRSGIKAVLMDQSLLAGVGNIYAQEALFLCRLSPFIPAADLTTEEAHRLLRTLKEVFGDAVRSMQPPGARNGRGFRRRVYGRSGEACLRCGSTLASARINGRGTVYCPECQKGPSR